MYRGVHLEVGKVSLGRLLIIMVNSAHNGTPDDDQLIDTVAVCVLEYRQTSNQLTPDSLRTIIIASLLDTTVFTHIQCYNCHKNNNNLLKKTCYINGSDSPHRCRAWIIQLYSTSGNNMVPLAYKSLLPPG